MAFIAKPPFPNVPVLPGVPQLKRSARFPPGPPPVVNSVIALGRLALALTTKPQWGIYKVQASEVNDADPPEGEVQEVIVRPPPQPVIVPDNFVRIQQNQAWDVTNAPVQEGGFATYNKVASPFEVRLRMTKGGSLSSRQKFLDQLETIANSLDLYRILTPERAYVNVNITEYRIVREGAQGAYFFAEVEIAFMEVRVVQAQYTSSAANTQNAKTASAKPVANQGTLNAIPPASRVATVVDNVLAPLRRVASIFGG